MRKDIRVFDIAPVPVMTNDVVRFKVVHVVLLIGSIAEGRSARLGLGIVIVGTHDVDIIDIRMVDDGRKGNQISGSDVDDVPLRHSLSAS